MASIDPECDHAGFRAPLELHGDRADHGEVMVKGSSGLSPAIIGAAVALALVVVSLPSFFAAGPEMDEGTLLAYPTFVVEHGLVPGRDFETFYGPGQPYLLALLGQVFGLTQTLERATGLAFELVIVLSLFSCALPAGRWIAATAALASALTLVGIGVVGLALLGGLAGTMACVALLHRISVRASLGGGVNPPWIALAAGALAGAALTIRPDLAPVVLLSAAPLLLWPVRGTRLGADGRRWLITLIVCLLPLAIWLIVVGPHDLLRLADDLRSSRGGRALPLPSVTSTEGGLVAATIVTTLGAAVGAFTLLRRDRFDREGRLMLSICLLLLALTPAMLQRADNAHVFPVAAIAIGLSPLVLRAAIQMRSGALSTACIAGAAAIVALAAAHAAAVTVHAQAISLRASERGVEVQNGDRSFLIEDGDAAEDLEALVPEIRRRTSAGDSIFVGPSDLSRTFYADTFVYFLFPELEPASFYTELNSGTANSSDSELPQELESADILLLTDRHTPDTDASAEAGDDAAQRVVNDRFCEVARQGTYRVLAPCRP